MRTTTLAIILPLVLMYACSTGVEPGSALSASDIAYIRSLGILDPTESIILFHSQSGESALAMQAGNFFTEKRIASYWIDRNDTTRNRVKSAMYNTIDTLVPVFDNSWPAGQYILVDLEGPNYFHCYVNGDDAAIRDFYNRVLEQWKRTASN